MKEKYRQSGYGKVWDSFLSDYRKGYSGCKSALMGCFSLAIVIVLKKFEVGLDSSRREFYPHADTLISICTFTVPNICRYVCSTCIFWEQNSCRQKQQV